MKLAQSTKGFGATATLGALISMIALVGVSQDLQAQSATGQPGPKPMVSPAVKAKAQDPSPGAKATKKAPTTKIGSGKAALSGTGVAPGDSMAWAEEIDVDGDGNVDTEDVALDNKHKVLYMADTRTFSCNNGGSADGAVLMAIYAKGNTLNKPVGSGWIVADLDAGECSVPVAGLYGCRFDASGNPTECGTATIQEQSEDIVIVAVPKKG